MLSKMEFWGNSSPSSAQTSGVDEGWGTKNPSRNLWNDHNNPECEEINNHECIETVD
jgi:hypothetical protein